jgi:acyl-CoA thioester hydrolase
MRVCFHHYCSVSSMSSVNVRDMPFEAFPLKTYDKIRYSDTDRQGHVNNAVFSSFLETGRVEMLYNPALSVRADNASFVIASLKLDFKKEILWPGTVEIGTGLLHIGTSSIRIVQKLFQQNHCTAEAETVIVHVHAKTGKSLPLSDKAKEVLRTWLLASPEAGV